MYRSISLGSIGSFRQLVDPGLFALANEPASPAGKNSTNVKPDNIVARRETISGISGTIKMIVFCIFL